VTDLSFDFKAKMWEYQGKASWHFVTLPQDTATIIKDFYPFKKGFGSVPVQVTAGQTHWKTSIFPDNSLQSYVLPIKASVRNKEMLQVGDVVTLTITVIFY